MLTETKIKDWNKNNCRKSETATHSWCCPWTDGGPWHQFLGFEMANSTGARFRSCSLSLSRLGSIILYKLITQPSRSPLLFLSTVSNHSPPTDRVSVPLKIGIHRHRCRIRSVSVFVPSCKAPAAGVAAMLFGCLLGNEGGKFSGCRDQMNDNTIDMTGQNYFQVSWKPLSDFTLAVRQMGHQYRFSCHAGNLSITDATPPRCNGCSAHKISPFPMEVVGLHFLENFGKIML